LRLLLFEFRVRQKLCHGFHEFTQIYKKSVKICEIRGKKDRYKAVQKSTLNSSADSTAYIPSDLCKQHNITVTPLILIWGEQTYQNGAKVLRQTGARSEEGYHQIFEQLAMGETPLPVPLKNSERMFRLGIGAFVAWLGFQSGQWLIILLGGVVMFSGIYDRCPI